MNVEEAAELSNQMPLVELVVDGARVVVTPAHGLTSIMQVAEQDAPRVLSRSAIELVEQTGDRVMPGFIPLGRFFDNGPDAPKRFTWSCLAGGPDVVAKAAGSVEDSIRSTGKWSDLATMFRSRLEHDPLVEGISSQPPIRWSWLVGALGHESITPIGAYEDHGLVMDPLKRRILVFSSPLDALSTAREFEAKGVEDLRLQEPGCLGCFLSGVGKELGSGMAKGALLDARWQIDFHTCPVRGPEMPSHFVIRDNGFEYHLVGCAEHGWPQLAEARWKGQGWSLDCGIGPW